MSSEHIKQANMQIARDKYPELSQEDAYAKLQEDIKEWRKKQMPSTYEQAKELASSLVKMSQHRFREVSEEEFNKRWDICTSCEFMTEKNRCVKCGCYMKIKARREGMRCKIGRW